MVQYGRSSGSSWAKSVRSSPGRTIDGKANSRKFFRYTWRFSQMTAAQDHVYHLQIAWLRWTSSRRSISLYPGENGRCSQNIENSQIGMSRHLDSSTTTQMAKIMVHYGRPSRSSWTKSVRSSFGRTIVGKAIWENPIETWLGENSKLGMSLCTSWKKNYSYLCMWMT